MIRHAGRIGALLLIAAVATVGCTRSNATEAEKAAAAARAQEAQQPRMLTMVVPAGTSFVVSLQTPLSTETNHSGDSFHATTMDAILVDGKTAVPAGARISGSLRDVQASGRIKGRARMTLVYDQIVDSEGKTHAISADPLTLQADSGTRGDVEKIAAGGVLGAIIGGIANGKKGAAIGATAGAGAGTIIMLATKGDEVELGSGQQLNVHLTSATSVQIAARR